MQKETNANICAATSAIEYLQEVGIYDLRELGEERFKTLIEIITKNYNDKLYKISLDDIPF